ncbi:uncharacterized protein LOC120408938 [Mauremys reevesii]|uniref:uncharacterized protein LOC120408938 n=1 Tax=Mauremys reevesii TaxID=260615 RepID=UPI00193F64CA|nr:uncharacterized protein LOC120408938 [Mauremys reevesii]
MLGNSSLEIALSPAPGCSAPSRPPGKGQWLQAPPGPGHRRSSGRTRGQMARWSRGRESSLEFAPWLPCMGPGAGTSGGCPGLEGAGEEPRRDWRAAVGEDMDWADVSLPCTARLAPRVQRTGPGLPAARLPHAQAVPCCSRMAKPQRTGEPRSSTYHCLTAPAFPGHALHAALVSRLCPHPCLGEIPPVVPQAPARQSSPVPADLSHPPCRLPLCAWPQGLLCTAGAGAGPAALRGREGLCPWRVSQAPACLTRGPSCTQISVVCCGFTSLNKGLLVRAGALCVGVSCPGPGEGEGLGESHGGWSGQGFPRSLRLIIFQLHIREVSDLPCPSKGALLTLTATAWPGIGGLAGSWARTIAGDPQDPPGPSTAAGA